MNLSKPLLVVGALVVVGAIALGGRFTGSAPSAADETNAAAAGGGTLRIGVESTEPVYYERGGEAKGFDHDMARSVAEGMGLEPEFVAMELHELFPALREGKIDMVGAQVTKTSDLEREFDFSAPYFSTYVAFLTPRGSTIHTRGDINGKRIAVVDGAIQESYLEEKYHDVEIVKAPNVGAALTLIGRGEADALFHGAPYAQSIIKSAPIALDEPIVYPVKDAPIAFVVRSGDQRREQIDGVLKDMVLGGEWLRIKTAYFEADPLSDVFGDKGS
ncbi:amino acid ABC transporter substrate-binding protein (PAAT family) [Nocardioides albertanoniae]|uniref:Amino acid ABC transporter substrate-binding protein (PAAT family) n=1 Tax=Nocardioides albertanoniae TaxID=1175486 RepID=A0A543AB74_9ACTN|nr:transporter substrate-binding domain-containing protein [Nocardioides albertanoniae]TQL69858.1 amino acid ABC transporter substrate-binding protein (PAAT family) [Nocardioides albertanoniae]